LKKAAFGGARAKVVGVGGKGSLSPKPSESKPRGSKKPSERKQGSRTSGSPGVVGHERKKTPKPRSSTAWWKENSLPIPAPHTMSNEKASKRTKEPDAQRESRAPPPAFCAAPGDELPNFRDPKMKDSITKHCYRFMNFSDPKRGKKGPISTEWPPMTGSEGFTFIEIEKDSNTKYKPGMVAKRPGAWLELTLDTTIDKALQGKVSKGVVGIVMLQSYEHMGTVRLTCVAGCSCSPVEVDCHWEKRGSTETLHFLSDVTPHTECRVRVEVLEATSSGEHKAKIVGVVIEASMDGGSMNRVKNPETSYSLYPHRRRLGEGLQQM